LSPIIAETIGQPLKTRHRQSCALCLPGLPACDTSREIRADTSKEEAPHSQCPCVFSYLAQGGVSAALSAVLRRGGRKGIKAAAISAAGHLDIQTSGHLTPAQAGKPKPPKPSTIMSSSASNASGKSHETIVNKIMALVEEAKRKGDELCVLFLGIAKVVKEGGIEFQMLREDLKRSVLKVINETYNVKTEEIEPNLKAFTKTCRDDYDDAQKAFFDQKPKKK
jgi:hypothetical protein